MGTISFSKWETLPDRLLLKTGISNILRGKANTLQEAFSCIYHLPYGRNKSRQGYLNIIDEGRGTCGTKHAFLVALARELNIQMTLMTGIYLLTAKNTPKLAPILNRFGITEMPEAHCFIQYNQDYFDVTGAHTNQDLEVLQTLVLDIDQMYPKKDAFHQSFIKKWQNKTELAYSLEEIWHIREECIRALSVDP